jgi:hypothetical protein
MIAVSSSLQWLFDSFVNASSTEFPIFGTLPPQQLERPLPDFVASVAQIRHDPGRQRILPEPLAPVPDQRVAS